MKINIEFRLAKNNAMIVFIPLQLACFYREGDNIVLSGTDQNDGEYTVTKVIHEISVKMLIEKVVIYLG